MCNMFRETSLINEASSRLHIADGSLIWFFVAVLSLLAFTPTTTSASPALQAGVRRVGWWTEDYTQPDYAGMGVEVLGDEMHFNIRRLDLDSDDLQFLGLQQYTIWSDGSSGPQAFNMAGFVAETPTSRSRSQKKPTQHYNTLSHFRLVSQQGTGVVHFSRWGTFTWDWRKMASAPGEFYVAFRRQYDEVCIPPNPSCTQRSRIDPPQRRRLDPPWPYGNANGKVQASPSGVQEGGGLGGVGRRTAGRCRRVEHGSDVRGNGGGDGV